jgi:hypothetical protein
MTATMNQEIFAGLRESNKGGIAVITSQNTTDRERIYDWLSKFFSNVESRLDAEGKVDLDGDLWVLAARIEVDGLKGIIDGIR